jgi:hypothetical protein
MYLLICVLTLIFASTTVDGLQAPVNADAKLVADFQARVKQYADLRAKVDGGRAQQKPTEDPAKLVDAKNALAANIQAARAGAKQGDIFTPDVTPLFKQFLKPALQGAVGAENKAAIKDDSPAPMTLKANAPYPEKQPLSTVPSDVLGQLPILPKDLEYRFVGKNLILYDSRASLIVDFLPNAMP